MDAKRSKGPTFYAETINSDMYVRPILTEFFPQLIGRRSYTWIHQDSATAHTAENSLTALEGVFGDKKISRDSELDSYAWTIGSNPGQEKLSFFMQPPCYFTL
jgi:hypothetical protein